MSWLSSFWNHNRNFLGNAIKNVAPAAFLIPGVGPGAAAALGGLGSALGQGIRKGSNFGDILKAGATGASEAYGGSELTGGQGNSLEKLKGMFHGGGSAADKIAAQGVPGVQFTPSSVATTGAGGTPISLAPVASAAPTGAAGTVGGLAEKSALSKALSFAHDNPMALAMGLQGGAQLAGMPAANALSRAQQQQIDLQNQQMQDDLENKKRRDEALAPLWKLMQQQVMGNLNGPGVAQNPYTAAGYQPRTTNYA